MANAVYPEGLDSLGEAKVNLLTDTIKVTLIDADYTYSAAHDAFNDVPAGARIATATLASKTLVGGVFDAADLTFTAVGAGSTVIGYIVWKDSGTESTSWLLCYVDRDASNNAISYATNGGDITLPFNASGIFSI